MCGRMNVIDDPLARLVFDLVGLRFTTTSNADLRPAQPVATLADTGAGLQQLDTRWGIKPHWSKKLLINAQAETVAEKRTFKAAFRARRCAVPCSGWYEWRDEGGPRKRRYLFRPAEGEGFLMAGIWYPGEQGPELVTLTTAPAPECAPYHHRMPLLIPPAQLQDWVAGEPEQLGALLAHPPGIGMQVEPH